MYCLQRYLLGMEHAPCLECARIESQDLGNTFRGRARCSPGNAYQPHQTHVCAHGPQVQLWFSVRWDAVGVQHGTVQP